MPRKRKRGSLTVKRKYHYITSEQPKEENHVASEPLVNIKATTDSSTQSESENVQFTRDHSYAIDEDSTYELDSFQETNNDKPEADVMECNGIFKFSSHWIRKLWRTGKGTSTQHMPVERDIIPLLDL
ncbi:hypothetical protein DPMN_156460 [Dreissena polymorpha]|uniref:Uncharacterized protein n=1 Tax=Dreissena polymorpha TaxID=45954 RepID=A0A9D4JCE1_DREPO|nr:hypothetical protein DPMN_156460 [Dreissena polymorpha]